MSEQSSPGALERLLAGPVREAIDRSAYGDWRTIDTDEAVSLSFGFPEPALFPEAELLASTEATLAEEGARALQYGGGEYAEALEEFVRERERGRGIDLDRQDVLITNGATHAIDTVCRAFLEPGETVLVEAPTFMGALGVFWNYGVELVGVPVDDHGLDVDVLAETLADGTDATLLYTIPDFHNPTGTTLSRERRERLLELAHEHDFAVLEDGAYSALHFDGEPPAALAALDDERVVRVGTFSKTIAPGIRLGWVSAPDRIHEALTTVSPGGTTTFQRSVVGHYCASGSFDELVPELRRRYALKRDHMLAELEAQLPADATWTEPGGGFFIWVDVPDVDTADLLAPAAETGVTYLPGTMFYPTEDGTTGMRLSFSFVSESELSDGIAALAEAVEAARAAPRSDR